MHFLKSYPAKLICGIDFRISDAELLQWHTTFLLYGLFAYFTHAYLCFNENLCPEFNLGRTFIDL